MSGPIGYDSDQAQHNVVLLTEVPEEIPAAAVIRQVDGNAAEDTSAEFTRRLEQRARELSSQIDGVRAWVVQNAQILSHAVGALQERDAINATDAQQALSVIDSASQPAPSTGSTSTGSTSTGGGGTSAFLAELPR
ncbi:hypothetical protein [Microbacterium testaceum]|uniref:Uncharacterized protein n=1 Tax=Microbacterium testaceum TaxID=2033 RepID=A0A2T7WL96_MICTE|nr:hypothetical protein [Microbacterium testaceum]PVE73809.1 hypothetical protein DC432_07735 [Microbacterium testaceum]